MIGEVAQPSPDARPPAADPQIATLISALARYRREADAAINAWKAARDAQAAALRKLREAGVPLRRVVHRVAKVEGKVLTQDELSALCATFRQLRRRRTPRHNKLRPA